MRVSCYDVMIYVKERIPSGTVGTRLMWVQASRGLHTLAWYKTTGPLWVHPWSAITIAHFLGLKCSLYGTPPYCTKVVKSCCRIKQYCIQLTCRDVWPCLYHSLLIVLCRFWSSAKVTDWSCLWRPLCFQGKILLEVVALRLMKWVLFG